MVPPIKTGWPTRLEPFGNSECPGPKARVAPLRWTLRRIGLPATVCSSTLTSVPVTPIAMPISAFFRAGASVDPIARHGNDVAVSLQGADDAQLIGR